MRNRCILGLLMVFGISLVSVVAFANSFTGEPAKKTDRVEIITQAAVSEEKNAAPYETPAATEIPPTATPYVEQDEETSGINEDDYLLAKIAMAEAESEDTKGKALVMLVVMNRVLDDEFPDTIKEVIFQKGQFSPIRNGRYNRVEPNRDCYEALRLIRDKGWDGSEGATYFESRSNSTWHSEHLTFLFRHGRHYFYKE